MHIQKPICMIILGSLMVATAQLAQAADNHLVTSSQLDQLKAGDSVETITHVLGSPENTTRWMNGTSSMLYEMSDHNSDQKLVFVDLDKNNLLTGVQIRLR
jgi:outer membrane protein assembly factor BamE (lipoprotein component of BamABCDE complex)